MKSNDVSEYKDIGASILEYEGPEDDESAASEIITSVDEDILTIKPSEVKDTPAITTSEVEDTSAITTSEVKDIPTIVTSPGSISQLITSVWYIILLLYLEMCLSFSCFHALSSYVYILHSSVAVGLVLYTFLNIKKKKRKTNHLISVIITAFLSFAYLSEVLYFKMFETFYSLSSFGNITNITHYWSTLLTILQDNIVIILLMILPVLIVPLRRYRTINYKPKTRIALGVIGLIIYIGMSVLLNTGFLLSNSDAAKFQSNTYEVNESIERFGCVISLQSDIVHLLRDITF